MHAGPRPHRAHRRDAPCVRRRHLSYGAGRDGRVLYYDDPVAPGRATRSLRAGSRPGSRRAACGSRRRARRRPMRAAGRDVRVWVQAVRGSTCRSALRRRFGSTDTAWFYAYGFGWAAVARTSAARGSVPLADGHTWRTWRVARSACRSTAEIRGRDAAPRAVRRCGRVPDDGDLICGRTSTTPALSAGACMKRIGAGLAGHPSSPGGIRLARRLWRRGRNDR